jgi:hypothetical protein
VLVRHLPRDSALLREVQGEAADWSVTDHLLALIADQLAEANWMFAVVNRDEDSEAPDCPQPVPRPGGPAPGPEDEPSPDRSGDGRSGDDLPSLREIHRFFA